MRRVSGFGAVAPTSMLSSKPTPDTLIATLGLESLLQESLRITVLMTRSIGPPGRCPPTGPYVLGRPPCRTDPGESVERTGACVTLGRTSVAGPAQALSAFPAQVPPRHPVVRSRSLAPRLALRARHHTA